MLKDILNEESEPANYAVSEERKSWFKERGMTVDCGRSDNGSEVERRRSLVHERGYSLANIIGMAASQLVSMKVVDTAVLILSLI